VASYQNIKWTSQRHGLVRDIELFNLALLAKHVQDGNSLIALVLKAVYFRDLNRVCRSIIEGRDVLSTTHVWDMKLATEGRVTQACAYCRGERSSRLVNDGHGSYAPRLTYEGPIE
jgi:hypothetical protein